MNRSTDRPRVKIVGRDHPHRGEYGRFTGEVIRLVTGTTMALVELENCKHGGDGCYVAAGDIRAVDDDDQFVSGRVITR
jgi:hypothetical protein